MGVAEFGQILRVVRYGGWGFFLNWLKILPKTGPCGSDEDGHWRLKPGALEEPGSEGESLWHPKHTQSWGAGEGMRREWAGLAESHRSYRRGPGRLLTDRRLSSGKSFLQKMSVSGQVGGKTVHSLPNLIMKDEEFGNPSACWILHLAAWDSHWMVLGEKKKKETELTLTSSSRELVTYLANNAECDKYWNRGQYKVPWETDRMWLVFTVTYVWVCHRELGLCLLSQHNNWAS